MLNKIKAVIFGHAVADALYGFDAIPKKWLTELKRYDLIEEMCIRANFDGDSKLNTFEGVVTFSADRKAKQKKTADVTVKKL